MIKEFILGTIMGGVIGYITAALMNISKEAEKEDWEEEENDSR